MKRILGALVALVLGLFVAQSAVAQPATSPGVKPRVLLKTSMGEIVIELEPEKAPKTVANFLQYVRDGQYDGTVFHRVIKNFMVQGGGFNQDLSRKKTRAPIKNEADTGLSNEVGTIAMARTDDPHSATAQFFINTKFNGALDHTSKTARGWGYTAFGRVVGGMNFVNRIADLKTGPKGPFPSDVPEQTVMIEKATVVGE